MKNPLNHYILLAKRWAWMILLGTLLCGGASFGISKITPRVYQASATLILEVGTSALTYDNFTASVQATPMYAQLLTSPEVLDPVVERHTGLTPEQLGAMITVKTQPNTPLIELDVENRNPQMAMELANEVSQSFAQFANAQLPGSVKILPAQLPTQPVRPKVLTDTAIGALVGLGLAIALIVIFEWLDDRPVSSEEVQELLDTEALTVIPHLSRKQRAKRTEEIPALAESYRILSANLKAAQAENFFKLMMVTSSLPGEGKSTSAANLAIYLATEGKRVLLVDANLRNPALDKYFQLDQPSEIASAFKKTLTEMKGDLYGQATDVPTLHVLAAGVLSSDSTDLLQPPWADRLFEHLKKAPFDYIIFDTPPLLPAADTQVLASHIQEVVLVVDPSKTSRKLLLRAKHLLNRTHNRVLGVVINKSRWPEHGEMSQYVKDTWRQRATAPPMTRPPEKLAVDGQMPSSEVDTVRLPRLNIGKEDQA